MFWIIANISDWINRIRPNRVEQMRARRAERRICHCGNARKFDKRLVGKDRIYFDYASLSTGPFSVVLIILYYLGLEP